ncbi:hypothetical protein BK138_05055 [Paenibacillus rhizosphaerae]|uniref:Copper amine oxidase-like N-terminal domain-containing protein n=1 Tax=Paenibacillus rhizosphaerae TaxID=297318 RepID=A0A1R1F1M2_9BACL|nr:hypothetical protein [Paenibacillus rhizosphaerae]OMF57947.1 hypothetical protein BK138_05055 [Paenibacillus rhizosphaerae]
MNKKHKRKASLLFAALLTAAGTAVVPSPSVQAEETPAAAVQADRAQSKGVSDSQATQAPELKWDFRGEFYDKGTGRAYYDASAYDGEQYYNRTVFRDPNGKWNALEEGMSVTWSYGLKKPILIGKGLGDYLNGLFSTVFDPAQGTGTTGVFFIGGKDNRSGLHYIKNYEIGQDAQQNWYSTSFFSVFLRTGDGVIKEVEGAPLRPGFIPMPDGRVLAVQYSSSAKMNEILIINPATGIRKHLVYASLDSYDVEGGRLLVRYNQPNRPSEVITLSNGKARQATEQDFKEFSNLAEKSYQAPIPNASTKPPADLQPQNLPVTHIQIHDQITARATIGGKVVYLSFAFIQNGRTMIPARELMEQAGLEVVQQKVAGKVNSSSFTLKGPGGSETVTAADSMMIGDRLYVGSNVLKRIGLPVQGMNWNP